MTKLPERVEKLTGSLDAFCVGSRLKSGEDVRTPCGKCFICQATALIRAQARVIEAWKAFWADERDPDAQTELSDAQDVLAHQDGSACKQAPCKLCGGSGKQRVSDPNLFGAWVHIDCPNGCKPLTVDIADNASLVAGVSGFVQAVEEPKCPVHGEGACVGAGRYNAFNALICVICDRPVQIGVPHFTCGCPQGQGSGDAAGSESPAGRMLSPEMGTSPASDFKAPSDPSPNALAMEAAYEVMALNGRTTVAKIKEIESRYPTNYWRPLAAIISRAIAAAVMERERELLSNVPETFYAHETPVARIRFLAEHWNRAVKAVNEGEKRIAELEGALRAYDEAMTSHTDGRDLLEQLCPSGWHHCDILVRYEGQDKRYEGDWLKNVWYARKRAAQALRKL